MAVCSVRLNPSCLAPFVKYFHSYNHPGAFVTGQSQSAKTASVATIMEEQIRQYRSVTGLDPHHQFTPRLIAFTLTLPKSRRDDLNVICPADGLHLAVNPLEWSDPAEIPAVVSDTRRMIKQAFGDAVLTRTQPDIDYWMDLALESTAICRLPLPIACDFLDIAVPHHGQLIDAIGCIDETLGNKLEALHHMPMHEYMNRAMPAIKRLETVLKKNPYTRDLLSNTETADTSDLIRPGVINLISLKLTNSKTRKKLLRIEDRRFFSCLYLKQIYRTIFARDEANRTHDHTIWIDELSTVESLFPDIEAGMRESAKYGLKVGPIIQDSTGLDGGQDSPLLRACMNNAHFHLTFRNQGSDNELFSTLPHIRDWHPRKPRYIHRKSEQYLASQRVIVLRNKHHDWMRANQRGNGETAGVEFAQGQSEDESDTVTNGRSHGTRRGTNNVTTNSDFQSQNPRDLLPLSIGGGIANASGTHEDEMEQESQSQARGRRRGRTVNRGRNQGTNSTASHTDQQAGGMSFNESIMPIHRFREVIQSIEFLSESQHLLGWRQVTATIPKGQCIAVLSELGVVHLAFPMPIDEAKRQPVFMDRQRTAFLRTLIERPAYLDPACLAGQYDRLIASVQTQLLELRRKATQLTLASSPTTEQPVEVLPPEDDGGLWFN